MISIGAEVSGTSSKGSQGARAGFNCLGELRNIKT